MIVSFRHRGLQRLFEKDDARGVKPDQVKRIKRILALLHSTSSLKDVEQLPGMRLHPLKGALSGFWSLSVSGNWRIIFKFEEGDASGLDLVDYH